MRIFVSHETIYRYDTPVTRVIQALRVTPRSHEGQHVVNWRIEVSEDCRLDAKEDAFGNITHSFTTDNPLSELTVLVAGEVETQDTHGIIRGAVERFPPSLYLRNTPLTEPDPAIQEFAHSLGGSADKDRLDLLHSLLRRVHEDVAYDADPTHVATTAAEAFALRRGVCQDLAHIFLSAARIRGIPSRYVGGYLRRSDGVVAQEAGHAWVESFVADLGWIAFDPAHEVCATNAHVRVAVGLDYLGAAPVRGTRFGGEGERLAVTVRVDQSLRQTQS
ncbi:MAG: transglutaminase family protein [Rhodoplanes sp.]